MQTLWKLVGRSMTYLARVATSYPLRIRSIPAGTAAVRSSRFLLELAASRSNPSLISCGKDTGNKPETFWKTNRRFLPCLCSPCHAVGTLYLHVVYRSVNILTYLLQPQSRTIFPLFHSIFLLSTFSQ